MRIDSTRERRPTAGFGWVDHRIVRDHHLAPLTQAAVAVYLVLCVVADRRGISYYSPTKLGELVKHSSSRVEGALEELAERQLVAREGRFVQVLSLDGWSRPPVSPQIGPGLNTPAPASRNPKPGSSPQAPVTSQRAVEAEEPEMILARLPLSLRASLLERARQKLCQVVRGREPSQVIVLAVAAGLAREEGIR